MRSRYAQKAWRLDVGEGILCTYFCPQYINRQVLHAHLIRYSSPTWSWTPEVSMREVTPMHFIFLKQRQLNSCRGDTTCLSLD